MPFTNNETLLVFRIAGIPFAIPAETVGSIIMPPPHITHAPGSMRSTPGIFHHADFTYAVIDLHERFGVEVPRRGGGRLLLHDEGGRHFAFIVDEVVGLIRSEQGSWANLPHYLPREIFSIGFLYLKEIVLCSELSLLRNMHDVEPLRRHLEQLQQKVEHSTNHEAKKAKTAPAATEPPRPASETTTTAAKSADTTVTAKPTATAAITRERKPTYSAPTTRATVETIKVTPHHTVSPPAPAAVKTPHTVASDTPATETSHRPPASPRPVPPRHPLPPSPTPSRVEVTPSRHTLDPAADQSDSTLLWLVLFLLILLALPIAYLFWPQSTHERQPRAIERVTPPVSVAEAPPAAPAELPLRIEQDDDGTINLIIDRKAAANDESTIAVTQDQPAAPTEEITATTEGETETAVADPAASSGPEPCDCTHIVVKGDTLWDIAERYTGDAFNYPQLARRSGIKNPHRIYPGNRVRIIIR